MKYPRWYAPGFHRIMKESSGYENTGFTRPYAPRKILQDPRWKCHLSNVLRSIVSMPQCSHLLILRNVISAWTTGEFTSKSGNRSIHDSARLLPSIYLKRGHPFHQVFISAVVLHEFHEFVEKNSLGSFHKMWSHCWLEILYSSSVWLSKFISIKQSFEDRCFSFQSVPEGWPPLFRFQFCYQSSIAFSNANHEVFPSKPEEPLLSLGLSSSMGRLDEAAFVS